MYVSASAPEPPPLERHHHRLLHQIVSWIAAWIIRAI
jgi:hypothetical protein